MRWISQHIWDFISRFRNDVYLEDLTVVEQEFTVQVAADGKLTKSTAPSERSRIQVRNDEGSVIPAGAPLYSRGEVGGSNRIKVGVCVSSDPAKMPCIGIAEFEMNTSSTKDSFAVTQGVYNTNISGFTGLNEGDILYVNGGVAPHLTPTKPTNGNLIQNVGVVLKTNGTTCQGLLVAAIGRTNDVPWPLYVDHANQRVGVGTASPTEELHVVGDALVTGDLTVSGTTTTINTTNLNIEDKNITLNYSTGDSSSTAGGAGITIQDAVDSSTDSTILWDATNDKFDFSHGATFNGSITVGVDDTGHDVVFYGATSGRFMRWDESANLLKLSDNTPIYLGTSNDLGLFHNGTNSEIVNNTGDLTIKNQANDKDIIFQCDDGSGGNAAYITLDGSAGYTTVQKRVRFDDNISLALGSDNDLQLSHDTTNSYINNSTGNLEIIQNTDDGDIIFKCDNGSGGLAEYIRIDGGQTRTEFEKPTQHADNAIANFGSSSDMQIYHNGTDSYILNGTGDLQIIASDDDHDIIFKCDDGSGGLATYITIDGDNTLTEFSKGAQFASGSYVKLLDGIIAYFGTGNDLQLYHDGSNSYISQNGTGHLYIENNTDDQDVIFRCDDGSGGTTNYFKLDGGDAIIKFEKDTKHFDSVKATFGNGGEFEIYHDGLNSYINNTNNGGHLFIQTDQTDKDIIFKCDDGSGGLATYIQLDGSLSVTKFSKNTVHSNGVNAYFGSSSVASISHSGTEFNIANGAGNMYLTQNTNDGDMIFECDDGSGGVTEYLRFDGGDVKTYVSKDMKFNDSVYATFGNNDLTIGHDGTNSRIYNYTGNLQITNLTDDADIVFQCDDGSGGLATYIRIDGSSADGTLRNVNFPDNVVASFGDSDDFKIYHYNSEQWFDNSTGDWNFRQIGVGNMIFQNLSDDKDIIFQSDDGSGGITSYITIDGSAAVTTVHKNLIFDDSVNAVFGPGYDLNIRHTGTISQIQNDNGDLYINQRADDKDIIFQCDDGSGGVTPYLTLDGGNTQIKFNKNTNYVDGITASFGNNGDLKISHGGTHSGIENETGNLYITNDANDGDIVLQSDNGSGGVADYITLDGSQTTINLQKTVLIGTTTNTGAYKIDVAGKQRVQDTLELDDVLTLNAISTPADPAAGKSSIYMDSSDGAIKVKINVGGTVVTRTIASYE